MGKIARRALSLLVYAVKTGVKVAKAQDMAGSYSKIPYKGLKASTPIVWHSEWPNHSSCSETTTFIAIRVYIKDSKRENRNRSVALYAFD